MRKVSKVAVLGAGVMGSSIACHFANAGCSVLLLDLPSKEGTDRQSHVNNLLQQCLKSKPSPIYTKKFISRIQTGNFEDDLQKISEADWIIEVVVERLDIKNQLFEKVEKYRKQGTLVTTNTSGIPIQLMTEERSEDFKKHFCGTHFFNPPRYLPLFEIIPTPFTDPSVVLFLQQFSSVILGKKAVMAKDTPAFIANRIGVYAMAKIFQLTEQSGLPIDTVDKLTGAVIGRPKTGTFRLGDLVGLDTAIHVINGIRERCPHDEQAQTFNVPKYLQFLLDNQFLGNKSGQGFYKKIGEKDAKGRPIIHALNLQTLQYGLSEKITLPSLENAKQIDALDRRISMFMKGGDAGAELVKSSLLGLFAYAANRIPEIADMPYTIDDALKAGFAWEFGPFEYWDIIGVTEGARMAIENGEQLPSWIDEMIAAGFDRFYRSEHGKLYSYSPAQKGYILLPGQDKSIHLHRLENQTSVYTNDEVNLHDIGDGVLCLEFTSKMNAIGEGILRGLNEAIRIAEDQGWKGLVIANHAPNFTVGANLMMIAMMAYQQEWDELNMAVNLFQQTTMRCRYSSIPVVAATQGYVFGGGCETIMHCDAVIASTESYIGLVEVGVGVIPGGGGTKEFAVRLSDSLHEGDVGSNMLIDYFKTIATAAVATSAWEAYDLHYLLPHKDQVIIQSDHRIKKAKDTVLTMAETYMRPIERKDIRVMGRGGLGTLYTAANELFKAGYASPHDIHIARKVAWVLCGGDLSGPQDVSEKYLLDIEREAFLSLCGEQKTQERIQHMLQTGKPLRN